MAKIKVKSGTVSSKTIQTIIDQEFLVQPLQHEEILTQEDIMSLPLPVQKYLIYTGALGKAKPQNVRIEFEAEMFRKPGDKAMRSFSCQYNFFNDYSRIFLMKASKIGIPFHARHIYRNQQATFIVRVAGLFNAVNIKGDDLSKAETVTVLNDMCIFSPGSLIDERLTWNEIDSLSVKVTFHNGKYTVSAILYFNEEGALINFVSNDRYALQDDGTMKQVQWTTPVSDYKELEGRKIPFSGKTIWNYPEGDFTYGVFRLRSIKFNVSN